ncbi:hypothetical protein BDB00DRAFT_869374 [Zychaea mexicana]|uniref:uncharacterized protein n=1 Tax=Zychaea mexicana TaxID=64656 RepID=UPI0022FDFF5C|nr:uncharacterized protein BDB00DRAFT_869374 [Zychaea mexicana]KAI9496434.1 hypothetical protein BDB00DRAFT_869374 [Zychaea mexicana]
MSQPPDNPGEQPQPRITPQEGATTDSSPPVTTTATTTLLEPTTATAATTSPSTLPSNREATTASATTNDHSSSKDIRANSNEEPEGGTESDEYAYQFEAEFNSHSQSVKEGNTEKAIQSFIMLQTNSGQNDIFQKYLVELADHIDPGRDSDMSKFFASLPALIQSTIVENATAYLEESDSLQAFQVLFDYIQAYPRHAYKYLIRAIDLLTHYAQSMETIQKQHSEKCIKVLVTELLQRLWKQRILLTRRDRPPTVKSTDSKHYIVISYNKFEQYMMTGQRYYIQQHNWGELVKFTCAMLDCCGYTGLGRLDFLSHTNRFQYMKEQRGNVRLDLDDQAKDGPDSSEQPEDLHVLVAFMCEFMAASAQFVQFGYEYYRAVCAAEDPHQEKSCLIPICAIRPSFPNNSTDNNTRPSSSSSSSSASNRDKQEATLTTNVSTSASSHEQLQQQQGSSSSSSRKRSAPENEDTTNGDNNSNSTSMNLTRLVEPPQRHTKKLKLDNIPDRGEGLNAYCMRGVDDALQILSKAADCMRHLVDLWQWGSMTSPKTNWNTVFGGWEEELCRVIDAYNLPFDVCNAVLLVRSDLALSSPSVPGNLAKALKLSQSICDRIEVQRRQEKGEGSKAPEFDIPFMFAFRVLYNIGVIYLLVGSIQQSTLEIAIILSVFPIPAALNEKDFIADEIDCRTVATVFNGHEFGMMRVTQEGLVVRCIKHLIVSLDSESEQRGGMASIDSAMRWDEKAGNIIVLMQYGWPYWSARTNFWHKIIQRMQERRIFKNRDFLEYVYVPEILQTIQSLHESDTVTLDIIPPEFALRSSYRHMSIPGGSQAGSVPSSPQLGAVSSPHAHPSISTSGMTTQTSAAAATATAAPADSHHHRQSSVGADSESVRSLPSFSSLPLGAASSRNPIPPPPPPIYQPSFTNTILPSMSMSPTWYSASAQKNAHANWMSPSFYYSRPATSVMLPKREPPRGFPGSSASTATRRRQGSESSSSIHENDIMTTEQMQRSFVPKDIVTRCLEYRVRRYSPKMTPQRMRHVLQKFLKNMVLRGSEEV